MQYAAIIMELKSAVSNLLIYTLCEAENMGGGGGGLDLVLLAMGLGTRTSQNEVTINLLQSLLFLRLASLMLGG